MPDRDGSDQSDAPSFEEALEKLESLVEEMEGDEVPLAKLVEKYEEGSALLKQCQGRLSEAEARVQVLKKTENGLEVEPLSQD